MRKADPGFLALNELLAGYKRSQPCGCTKYSLCSEGKFVHSINQYFCSVDIDLTC